MSPFSARLAVRALAALILPVERNSMTPNKNHAPPFAVYSTPRAPLDRNLISRTALLLIDEQGIEQLSMRKLGAALGVEAMALYHHFSNKAELVDGILNTLLVQMENTLPESAPPLDTIRAICMAMRQLALDHPHIFPALIERRLGSRHALYCHERLLGLFRQAGLDDEPALRYLRLVSNFTVGGAFAEIANRTAANEPAPPGAMADPDIGGMASSFRFGLDVVFHALHLELGADARCSTAAALSA